MEASGLLQGCKGLHSRHVFPRSNLRSHKLSELRLAWLAFLQPGFGFLTVKYICGCAFYIYIYIFVLKTSMGYIEVFSFFFLVNARPTSAKCRICTSLLFKARRLARILHKTPYNLQRPVTFARSLSGTKGPSAAVVSSGVTAFRLYKTLQHALYALLKCTFSHP